MPRRSSCAMALLAVTATTLLAYAATNNTNGTATVVARASGPIVLTSDAARIVLQPVQGSQLTSSVDKLSQEQHVYLVIRDLEAAAQPTVLYRVYLGLPEGSRPDNNSPHYVGTLNFYNAVPLRGTAGVNGGVFRSFDVTPLLRNMREQKALGDITTITVVPSGPPAANAKPSIGRIELVQQ